MSNKKSKATKKMEEKTEEKVDLMAEIKKMEAEKREKAMESKPKKKSEKKDDSMSFDQWWMRRSKKIPQLHRKEIIRADFKGRGLSDKARMEEWDKALKSYGVDIK